MKQQFTFSFEKFSNLNELPEKDRTLLQKALANSKNAYAPYSQFHVGACIRLQNGTFIDGNNQENASYPQGLCAERVAFFCASANYPDQIIEAIALISSDGNEILSPCGACRQVMLEYEQKQKSPIRILMANTTGQVIQVQCVKDLLPFSFTKDNLYIQ